MLVGAEDWAGAGGGGTTPPLAESARSLWLAEGGEAALGVDRLASGEASVGCPQASQKRAWGRSSVSHPVQNRASALPQRSQNRAPGRFSVWQEGQGGEAGIGGSGPGDAVVVLHVVEPTGEVLELTAAGEELLQAARPLWDAAQQRAVAFLGEDAAASIASALD